jgi:micrococcal nuclease
MAVAHVAAMSSPERSAPVLVRYVIDGDTIDVAGIGRVRLLGIDAPEIGSSLEMPAPLAVEAKHRLAALIASRWVRLEYDATPRDAYDRRLAYVVLDNSSCVNETLVREGLARVSARMPLNRLADLKRAEAEARAFRRGIWAAGSAQPSERYVIPRSKPRARKRGGGRERTDGRPPPVTPSTGAAATAIRTRPAAQSPIAAVTQTSAIEASARSPGDSPSTPELAVDRGQPRPQNRSLWTRLAYECVERRDATSRRSFA